MVAGILRERGHHRCVPALRAYRTPPCKPEVGNRRQHALERAVLDIAMYARGREIADRAHGRSKYAVVVALIARPFRFPGEAGVAFIMALVPLLKRARNPINAGNERRAHLRAANDNQQA